MKNINLRLDDDLHAELKQKARQEDRSLQQQIIYLLRTDTDRRIWAAWNSLPDNCPAPVKQIARGLHMAPADVAITVYPPEQFGLWEDDQEPDLG